MRTEPTLADDERQLAAYADALHAGVVAAIPGWVGRTTATRAASGGVAVDDAALDDVATATVALVDRELRRILDADVDQGAGSPLEAVRAAVGPVTTLLETWGAAHPARDDFVADAFPDDRYEIGPASFADIDEALHEPGLIWGAARAHVHLRRRREARDGG